MAIRAAAVVVPFVGERSLIIERAATLSFQPGFHSYPGGRIDASDRRPGGPPGAPMGAAWAALRELVEELGVGPGLSQEIIDKIRSDEFFPEDVDVDWSRWRYLGVWTTPAYAGQRFETHFFSCRLDAETEPSPNDEVARARWLSAAAVEAEWRAGELLASPPVLAACNATFSGGTIHRDGDARDLLCAGGPVRYLPLETPTLPPASHTNCAFLRTKNGLYAVDPAAVAATERALLWRHVEALAEGGEPLVGVIISHLHHDHIGAASWLAERAGVPILASRRTAEDLRGGHGASISAGGFRLDAAPVVTDLLAEGDELGGGWTVLETPGHAWGHLCFRHAESRSLVAGDMIAGGSTILIEPGQGDLKIYVESLQRLADLEPRFVLPSHGMPFAVGAAALRALIAHRLKREAKTVGRLERLGPCSLEALLASVYDDTPRVAWPMAELSLMSHLHKLRVEGRARQDGEGRWLVDAGAGAT